MASGSKGNATYVEGGGVRLLIDAGISCRDLEKRLAAVGRPWVKAPTAWTAS